MFKKFSDARACLIALIVSSTLAAAITPTLSENTPAVIWLTQAGDAKVQVSRCGTGICGKVVWLKDPIDKATGRPQIDDKNPNPALKNRPMIGLQLFSNMQPSGPNAWSGVIYNADDGQSYASTVAQLDTNRLEVRGCVGALCGSEIWTRSTR
jgi:uncharacterized protein (DUF2147 family)